MSFNKYDNTSEPVELRVLTDDEKKTITDSFAEGKSVTEIKHEYFLPSSLIKNSISHKKETEELVVQLMKEEVIMTPEESHYDDESMERVIDVEEVKNTKPSTLAKLKTEMAKLKDCSILDYNIDSIIANGTVAGTWSAFKECF